MPEWQTQSFISGTVTVQRTDGAGPHLYVHYAADLRRNGITEDECDRKRSAYAKDLAIFLNGGPRPTWMDTYRREGPTYVKNSLGGTITATGPMVLPPNDNGRLAWVEDNSEQSVNDRVSLVERLGCLPSTGNKP